MFEANAPAWAVIAHKDAEKAVNKLGTLSATLKQVYSEVNDALAVLEGIRYNETTEMEWKPELRDSVAMMPLSQAVEYIDQAIYRISTRRAELS